MTTDNNHLWKSTIVVALVVSVISLYSGSFFIGRWVFCDLPVTLWCIWLGILISTKIHIPVWLRVIIICSCVGLYFFFSRFSVQIAGVTYPLGMLGALKYVILLLIGIGLSPNLKQNNKFWENVILSVAFLFMYVFMVIVEQRASYCLYTFEAKPMAILITIAKYGKAIPLAAAVLFCGRMALSDKMQTVLSRKGISITALALILAVGTFNLVRSAIDFGQIHLSVVLTNPAISIMIILCIEKFVKDIQSKSTIRINDMNHSSSCDCNLPEEEHDEETTANLLKSLREAIDAWLKENPKGLD